MDSYWSGVSRPVAVHGATGQLLYQEPRRIPSVNWLKKHMLILNRIREPNPGTFRSMVVKGGASCTSFTHSKFTDDRRLTSANPPNPIQDGLLFPSSSYREKRFCSTFGQQSVHLLTVNFPLPYREPRTSNNLPHYLLLCS